MKTIFLETAIKAAKAASEILKKNTNKKIETNTKVSKVDGDWVTKYDLLCQKKIVTIINAQFPNHDFLGEENLTTNKGSEYKWVIDPIDGTSNFSHGIPYFCVSIALTYKDQPIVGVIAIPMEDKIVWAEKNRGAYCNGKRISVSNISKLNQAMVGIGLIRTEEGYKKTLETMHKFAREKIKFRSFGSIATDLAHCALGQLDAIVIHKANPWDVLAGMLIVTEAGGTLIESKEKTTITATNGYLPKNFFI